MKHIINIVNRYDGQKQIKRKMRVYYKSSIQDDIPMIRIANRHLKEFDFNIGDEIEITYRKGVLIIKKKGSC